MKKVTRSGKTIVFYQKEGDIKYSFLIENEPELTEKLLTNIKTKRVIESNIPYAARGIFEKLFDDFDEYEKAVDQLLNSEQNPIVTLSEMCQKKFGSNIKTTVVGKTGPDHRPIIAVEIELPTGEIITAMGYNQKEAKRKAAKIAIKAMITEKDNRI